MLAHEAQLEAEYLAQRDAQRATDAARWARDREAEIAAGLRNAAGEWVAPDPVQVDEEEVDEEEVDEEEADEEEADEEEGDA